VEGIVVIDRAGLIVAVNQPWQNMTFQNNIEPGKPAASTGVGANFLALCHAGVNFSVDKEAFQAREGVKAVLDGRLSHFSLEFASHQLLQLRWLSMSASPMGPDGRGAVIAHADVTARKKNEAAAISHQDDLEAMVFKRTAELRALAMQLLQTETRERQAVAADLHDDLGQILAVAKLKLTSLTVPEGGQDASQFLRQLKDIENMIDRSSVSVRSLSTQLSPPTLYRHGLNAALEWLAEEMMRTYGLLVELDLGELALLDEAVSSTLFRMVRELLINVWKHGQVHYAKVTMRINPDNHALTISVADNGAGFEVPAMLKSTTKHSYGLFSISERLKLIGGTVQIDSHLGSGTTVTMVVPSVRLNAEFEGAER
jgi:signal transduction histidine kinase